MANILMKDVGNEMTEDWFMEELFLGRKYVCAVVTDSKSQEILGYTVKTLTTGKDQKEEMDLKFLEDLLTKFKPPGVLYSEPSWSIKELGSWCEKKGIKLLTGSSIYKVGKVFEYYVICDILGLTTNPFKMWRKTWPGKLKNVPHKKKAELGEFRELLYGSSFFEEKIQIQEHLEKGMRKYNEKEAKWQILEVEDIPTNEIKLLPKGKEMNVEEYLQMLSENTLPKFKPILNAIAFSFRTQLNMQMQLLAGNKKLMEEVKYLEEEQKKNQELIKELVDYKNVTEYEKKEKMLRREKRLNRKKRQATQPFMKEYLPYILKNIEKNKNRNNLTKIRLRVALVCLVVTGLRISEVRLLKVAQIISLFKKNYLEIDLLKGGRTNYKRFLTSEGTELVKGYRKDLQELIFLSGIVEEYPDWKTLEDIEPATSEKYLFSGNKGQKPLAGNFFMNLINRELQETPELKERGVILTSHSFRRGYITSLWKKTRDLEFVRQVIGHEQIQTTSHYVQGMSDEEKQLRLKQIS